MGGGKGAGSRTKSSAREKKRRKKTSGEVEDELELVMMSIAVGNKVPFSVFVLYTAVAVVHGVRANRDQSIHDED